MGVLEMQKDEWLAGWMYLPRSPSFRKRLANYSWSVRYLMTSRREVNGILLDGKDNREHNFP